MKLKSIISSLIAILAIFTSCTEKYEALVLAEVQVSSSYVALPADGGSQSIQITASDEWTITDVPTWLKVSPASGTAGQTKVTFEADTAKATNSCTVKLNCKDASQLINVLQMTEKVELPITSAADLNSKKTPDGATYRAKGVVTKIANTLYGNWYLNDGTMDGDGLYIYGTLDAAGAEKNFESLGIEQGDIVTVEGPKSTYQTTPELVNVTVISIEKSLIKVDSLSVASVAKDGGDVTVYLTNKGDGISIDIPEAIQSWLTVKSIVTKGTNTEVTLKLAANEGGARTANLSFGTTKGGKAYTATTEVAQEGSIQDVTCAQFNAQADGSAQYKVHGIITSIANTKYGNLYINDGTGEVYVYGITDWNADDFKVGDEVVLQSVKTSYKNAPQMKDAIVVEKVAHEVKTAAELQTLSDDKNTYYLVTGTVFKMTGDNIKFDLTDYGNFGLKDETGEIYVYGVADGLDGKTKNFAATGVKEGDTITILAYKTSYKGLNQIVGKFIKNLGTQE